MWFVVLKSGFEYLSKTGKKTVAVQGTKIFVKRIQDIHRGLSDGFIEPTEDTKVQGEGGYSYPASQIESNRKAAEKSERPAEDDEDSIVGKIVTWHDDKGEQVGEVVGMVDQKTAEVRIDGKRKPVKVEVISLEEVA